MWMAIVASIGPIGLLCINRTLKHGFWAGTITGVGVSVADAIYGCIAGFGLTFISDFLISHQLIIRLIGGLFLCYLGLKIFFKAKTPGVIKEGKKTYIGDFLSAFILTLTNPMTIITFIAVFASMGIGSVYTGYNHAVIVIAGIFFGSLLWYLILSSLVSLAHKRINAEIMRWINIISGVIIIIFGILAIIGFGK
jgi:threonine/homoserine/homoserine lactone efflux protein